MAGRGTDIKLDDEAKAAGGLKIIGTERHESRRIDNQLRGRSGRQGDPGESRFYISLEDDLMRLFGSERLMTCFNPSVLQRMSRLSIRCFPVHSRKHRRRSRSTTSVFVKTCWSTTRLTTSSVRSSMQSAASAGWREYADSIYKMITDRRRIVDTCIADDQDTSEWNLQELNGLLIPIIPLPKMRFTENEEK